MSDIPEPCRSACDFVEEMFEKGRLSSVERDALLDGIWPVRIVDGDNPMKRRAVPLLRLIKQDEPRTQSEAVR